MKYFTYLTALIFAVLFWTNPGLAQQTQAANGLVIRGSILRTTLKRNVAGFIDCEFDVRLEFVNTGRVPIIVMRPLSKEVPWYGGALVSRTRDDAVANRNIVTMEFWPSVFGSREYRNLAKRLDKLSPPSDLTRILSPNESWTWLTEAFIRFSEREDIYKFPHQPGWDEIGKLSSPIWVRLMYETWPFNVEYFRHDLGRKLQRRWRKIGRLWVGEWNGRFNIARLASEPMELDLTESAQSIDRAEQALGADSP